MARRRAVSPEDKAVQPERLPMFYRSLAPLAPERHAALRMRPERDHSVTAESNAIPLTADEFPTAMRDYPIVIAMGDVPTPVALVGFEKGRNDHVDADGKWRDGTYVPAYVRRYPFALLKESKESERHILCADLSSTLFSEGGDDGQALFDDGDMTATTERALDFCQRYAAAADRTRSLMKNAAELGLIEPSSVSITRGESRRKVDGFAIISEEKLRNLDDTTLADLARRGILSLFAAHQMSLANFSSLAES